MRIFVSAAFLAGTATFAATPSVAIDAITVGEERLIPIPGLELPLVEPHLSVNPRDPRQILVAAMLAQEDGSYTALSVASRDGGRTWESHDFGPGQGADVWTAFLPDGTAILSFLAGPDASLQIHRSSDGGRTWSERAGVVARGQDHPTLLVAPDGSLYTVSAGSAPGSSGETRNAVVVARSTDGGATFAEPRLISESCDGRGGWSSLAAIAARSKATSGARRSSSPPRSTLA